jgi:hypothetical protein
MALEFLNDAYFAAKVGIGTESPTTLLHIDQSSNDRAGGLYIETNASNYGLSMFVNSGGYGVIGSNGTFTTDILTLDLNSGNVGIGASGPGVKLDVAGEIRTSSNFIADNATLGSLSLRISGTETGRLDNFNSALRLINFHATSETAISGNGNISLTSIGSSNIELSTANTERMRITSTGGISFGSTGTAYGTSGQILKSNGNASPTWIDGSAIPGVPAGSGTVNTVAMWTPDGDTLGDSPITISGNDITSSGRGIIENTTNLTTGVVDSLLIKTLSSGTSITNGFGAGLSFYLENTVYSVVNEVAKISVIETDTIAIDDKMVFSVKDNNTLAERLTLTGSEAVFTGNVGIGVTVPTEKLHLQSTTSGCFIRFADQTASGVYVGSRNNELEIYAGNSERMGIDATGVVRFNAYGTGILQTDTNGVISASLSPLVDGITFNNGASITNQINTDVDTGTETVASVAIATYTAAFFDFVIKKTTNVRSGTVYACHDGTNVEFTETSTQDLGDTSDVTLSVDISGGSMRLRATTTSDDWSVKSLIRAI